MDKMKELFSDKEFTAKLKNCMDTGKVQALAKEYGTELTVEEAKQAINQLKVQLPDEDLDKVAGGVIDIWGCKNSSNKLEDYPGGGAY